MTTHPQFLTDVLGLSPYVESDPSWLARQDHSSVPFSSPEDLFAAGYLVVVDVTRAGDYTLAIRYGTEATVQATTEAGTQSLPVAEVRRLLFAHLTVQRLSIKTGTCALACSYARYSGSDWCVIVDDRTHAPAALVSHEDLYARFLPRPTPRRIEPKGSDAGRRAELRRAHEIGDRTNSEQDPAVAPTASRTIAAGAFLELLEAESHEPQDHGVPPLRWTIHRDGELIAGHGLEAVERPLGRLARARGKAAAALSGDNYGRTKPDALGSTWAALPPGKSLEQKLLDSEEGAENATPLLAFSPLTSAMANPRYDTLMYEGLRIHWASQSWRWNRINPTHDAALRNLVFTKACAAARLTDRQIKMLNLASFGWTSAQIGSRLDCTEKTAENTIRRARQKLRAARDEVKGIYDRSHATFEEWQKHSPGE